LYINIIQIINNNNIFGAHFGYMVIRLYLILYLGLCCCISLMAGPIPTKNRNYLTTKAKAGQGVYGLLRSYKLLDNPVNVDLFYQINGIPKGTELVKNQNYKLPVSVHSFDGKSIRSSIGLNDMEKAKQIEKYNSALAKSDLRKRTFKEDKKLWVPVYLTGQYEAKNIESKPAKAIQVSNIVGRNTEKEDPRKQFLVASLSSTKSMLVADHKLTDEELRTLNEKVEVTSMSSDFAIKGTASTVNVPLFGDNHETVTLSTNALKNEVFYIVPGHGGPDPGAIAKNVDGHYTICEDEYAYDVSLRLAKNLIENGATVYVIVQDKNDGIRDDKYLICDCDEKTIGGHTMPLSQKKRLKQGISKVNKLFSKHKKQGIKNQWMVSLHIDAQSEESRQDVFFYYQSESALSKNKAIDIQQVFEEKYQIYRKSEEYNGTVSSRPLYVVRHSEPEPIFIELANIHNPEDRKRILYPKNRQLLADWITEGFLK
jgi:N-acetylmuramoyl-L-alanine amidase